MYPLVRPISDVHLEFADYRIPELPTDKETVLVLAGDIGLVKKMDNRLLQFLLVCSYQFKAVVYVFGNHEFYGGSLAKEHQRLKERLAHEHVHNVHVLENEKVEIDGVVFLGATLWTDYNNANYHDMSHAEFSMYDYKQIRNGTSVDPYKIKLTARDLLTVHNSSKNWLFRYAEEAKEAGKKTVIVTHHGVTWQSIADQFRGDQLNPAFVSDLTKQILEVQPDLMIHGHVHNCFDYMVGDTRVVVNPRGYRAGWGQEDTGFNPLLNISFNEE